MRKMLFGLTTSLGILVLVIILFMYARKVNGDAEVVTDIPEQKDYEQGYPMPNEITDSEKRNHFFAMNIPQIILDRIQGVSYTEGCPVSVDDLRYVNLLYWGTDSKPHTGEMIVNKAIADDIIDIFYNLYKEKYPIYSIQLVDDFKANDEVSMAKNNTSAFNCRNVAGTNSISMHAYGFAIDINPFYNPYIDASGKVYPVGATEYADRKATFNMKIDEKDLCYKLFTDHGFTWGGSWDGVKDYQHFEKNIK